MVQNKIRNWKKRGNTLVFYSRKHKKWFSNYKKFKKYDRISKIRFYLKTANKLKYNKNTGYLYDPTTGRRFRTRRPN